MAVGSPRVKLLTPGNEASASYLENRRRLFILRESFDKEIAADAVGHM